ncbi:MAG TPA: sigma 54-interacting transcriptional regulator [Clostridia bacterium]|nr:sigma 54-interacting transcriptional regulator [Clostridia bacterium]
MAYDYFTRMAGNDVTIAPAQETICAAVQRLVRVHRGAGRRWYPFAMPQPGPEKNAIALQRYRALLDVADSIALHRDLKGLLHDLAERLASIVNFDWIDVILYDQQRDVVRSYLLEGAQLKAASPTMEVPACQSISKLVIDSQRSMVVDDIDQVDGFPKLMTALRGEGVKSICVLPLTTAQGRLGALGFGSKQVAAYRQEDADFLQRVATHVALAVCNTLNYERLQEAQVQLARDRDRIRMLLEINNAVVRNLEFRELFVALSKSHRDVEPHHDYASVALYDERTEQLRIFAIDFLKGKGLIEHDMTFPLEGAAEGWVFHSRRPLRMSPIDVARFPSDIMRRLVAEGIQSACFLPLIAKDKVLGILTVACFRSNTFSDEDVEYLRQIANQVAIGVENALAFREIAVLKDKLAEEKLYLEDEIRTEFNFDEIVGESAALKRILKQVETVAPTDATVLVLGETGTGKELIARAIHRLSMRSERTFVKLNCAAIPTGLLESELFGHERGAFTGAIAQKIGRLELAHGGTLFLDEVGDIPLELQPKLLRALQEREFERLGATRTIRVDARLVAATNRDLAAMVKQGTFRSDLYYRLNVFPMQAPPLRERPEDIPALVRYFVQKYSRRMNRRIESIPSEAMRALAACPWPGNIRELENYIERAVILTKGPSLHVPLAELKTEAAGKETASPVTLEDAERAHIVNVLRESRGVIAGPNGAAERLGLKRTTLQSKMQKLGISRLKY